MRGWEKLRDATRPRSATGWADLAAFRSLPSGVFEACDMRPGRVSSTALARYRNVDYSVPTAHAYTTVLVKGFVDEVVIAADGAEIARHP